jgi:Tfp pilus assembly protein PilX
LSGTTAYGDSRQGPCWRIVDWEGGQRVSIFNSLTSLGSPFPASQVPRFVVEHMGPVRPREVMIQGYGNATRESPQQFRVTARGYGIQATTWAMVQSSYVRFLTRRDQ